jgi:hypothetical protein
VFAALTRLPRAVRRRRVVSSAVEERLRVLEGPQALDRSGDYGESLLNEVE